jgi:hypothetical protein
MEHDRIHASLDPTTPLECPAKGSAGMQHGMLLAFSSIFFCQPVLQNYSRTPQLEQLCHRIVHGLECSVEEENKRGIDQYHRLPREHQPHSLPSLHLSSVQVITNKT